MTEAPGPIRRWVLAARIRTLPAAVVPVAVGVASVTPRPVEWARAALAAVVALSLQVGTNYANDYSDGVRGTDAVRVGPFRLTASGLVAASSVRLAAWLSFAVAAVAGLVLAAETSWWLVLVGLSAIAAGWFYTGGPKPYGYYGFGELFVLVYFGGVATVGTAYVQHAALVSRAWPLSLACGAMACLMLEANNLRDVRGDQEANKKTLAARLGRHRAVGLWFALFALLILGLGLVSPWLTLVCVAYVPAIRFVLSSREGRDLLPLLQVSARAQLVVGAITVVALAWWL